MPYQPKYCCQCGEKIENVEWKLFSSRRFCQLCATEYGVYDWIPRAATGIGLLLTVFFIGSYFRKPEKPLNVAPGQLVSAVPNGKTAPGNQTIAPAAQNVNAVQLAARQTEGAPPSRPTTAADADRKKSAPPSAEAIEKVYFCGAATRKGTMCSHRVKGGGRCWQHAGQPALLAADKLLISAVKH